MLISDCGSCLKVGSQEHFIPKKKKEFCRALHKVIVKGETSREQIFSRVKMF